MATRSCREKCVDQINTPVPEPKKSPSAKARGTGPFPIPMPRTAFAYIIRNTGESPPWCMPVTVPQKRAGTR